MVEAQPQRAQAIVCGLLVWKVVYIQNHIVWHLQLDGVLPKLLSSLVRGGLQSLGGLQPRPETIILCDMVEFRILLVENNKIMALRPPTETMGEPRDGCVLGASLNFLTKISVEISVVRQ